MSTYTDLERNENFGKLEVGNILPFEAMVADRVASDDFATIDLRTIRNVVAEKPFILDDEFIAGYTGKEPNWGELGWFTFKRTYARRIELEDGSSKRTEEWTEVVRRVVEGNLNILKEDPVITQEYGQKLFKLIWNLVFTPPGRGLWISGTPFADRTGDAHNNCWFVETRPYHYGESNKIFTRYEIDPSEAKVSYPFVFLFDQSMKGGGVGFSAEEDVVSDIPKVMNRTNVYFYLDESHGDFEEVKATCDNIGAKLNQEFPLNAKNVVELSIADTREGWAEAYGVTIDEHFRSDEEDVVILFSLNEIRASGTPIRGFGGTASGSAPLVELLNFASERINDRVGGYIDSVLATDLHNHAGKCTVAGNVRRTAEVALGSNKDNRFVNMKNYKEVEHLGGWREKSDGSGEWEQYEHSDEELLAQGYTQEQINEDRYTMWAQNNHRWASNNSIVIDDPRGYEFGFIAPAIGVNGEPGIFNRFLAQNFGRVIDGYKAKTDKARGGNPCMEISLESSEPCNLVEYHLPVAEREGFKHKDVIPFMVHYAKRVTFTNYDWELSAKTIRENRRIGVSLSGFMDWVLLKFGSGAIEGWQMYALEDWHDMVWLDNDQMYQYHDGNVPPEYDPELFRVEPVYNPELVEELDYMYKLVIQADIEYSAVLTTALGYEVKPSVKDTTVKPSGTVSLLSGISPGVHAHYFRYGIRRIRVQSNDPLLKMMELAGYKTEPSKQSPNSHVIEFPFKAPTADYEDFRSIDEITIEEQFALQNLLCVYWADNMVSCTITFHENEKPKIKHLLEQYRMRIKSTSLLPYSGHGYVQAPYEPTSEEEWAKASKAIHMQPQELYHILMDSGQLEDKQMDLAEAVECAGGQCPTK